jgi:hypothetical protein
MNFRRFTQNLKFNNRKTNPNPKHARCTRTSTQLGHSWRCHAGAAVWPVPHVMHTQRDRERGRPSPSSGRRETEEGGRPAAPAGRGGAPAMSGSGGVAGGLRASLGSHSLAKGCSWPPGHGSGRLRPRPPVGLPAPMVLTSST